MQAVRCHFPHFRDIQLWVWVEMVDLIRPVSAVHPPLSQVTLEQPSGSIWSGQQSASANPDSHMPRPKTSPTSLLEQGQISAHLTRLEGEVTAPYFPQPHRYYQPRCLDSSPHTIPQQPVSISGSPSWRKASSLNVPYHLSDHPNLTAFQG